ncbi:Phosphomethylpyrimidine synthase [Anaerohalosphaera lusitana]|uniref:Phosphomethylpyrimidine synthase n=1 Tax=Anaerohalosphaera lusitana TaxID=1936003 RepID=A0A1U9NGI3_9BACT|nr:phosphomethylpyrimidine synthase ThiC [Anaerohalosphaera lusitana]AQT67051.1 Phosphomethylpyrimidine synthase [Anaerohalosphaera lusitana]
MATQLEIARAGKISDVMKRTADREGVSAELIRDELAAGRLVIPANKVHVADNLEPAAIGRAVSVKINANIGASDVSSSLDGEIEKMKMAISLGADAMMDLSTGEDLDAIRERLIAECPVMFGTVPVYEVIVGRGVEDIDHKTILEVAEKQAKQGVDFFTIHAGLLREHLPLTKKRVCGIVSRGGALMAKWMVHHDRQNPMYELFDDLCDIMREYDVAFSLGDGLRPGCGADATDEAQIAELRTLGELASRAQEKGCQVMVEGPGHVPYDQIKRNMELQQDICNDAPFYVLGPLVTDSAPGYDHITSAIGGTAAAFYGASFLCYVTPREHLGLPDVDDVRQGVIASKIAAHAADVARGFGQAAARDRRLSEARANLEWDKHIAESLDPKTAQRMHEEACARSQIADSGDSADYCTMCGRDWCSVRINREVRDQF